MLTIKFRIAGISPYSQSRHIDKAEHPKIGKEPDDKYEKRTWQERIHRDDTGVPFMPAMSIKKALDAASVYLGKIPGQKNATYVKRFKSGVLVTDNLKLFTRGVPVHSVDDFQGEWLFLDANGKPGGTRVKRCMPRLFDWLAEGTAHLIDEVLDEEVFERALIDAGRFVGLGRFRPQMGGYYGRFKIDSLEVMS